MTPGELLDTELRIAYVELHDRLERLTEACNFWRELAQHYAKRLDDLDFRRDPLHDLFPKTVYPPHPRDTGESAVTSYPPYPADSSGPPVRRTA